MNTDEALRRVRLIMLMLRNDVETAINSHAVLEACNATVPKGLQGHTSDFVQSYNITQNALALKLATDLARIYDISAGQRFPKAQQDKASIPVLTALLNRQDVQSELKHEAAKWLPGTEHVNSESAVAHETLDSYLKTVEEDLQAENVSDFENALNNFFSSTACLEIDTPEATAFRRIREFRTKRIAHSLFDQEPNELPRYGDMDILLGLAKKAVEHAALAVEGLVTEFNDQAKRDRLNADGYAVCTLNGMHSEAEAVGN